MCNMNGDDSVNDSSFISSLLKSLSGGGENQQREQQQRSLEYVINLFFYFKFFGFFCDFWAKFDYF